MKKGVNVAAKLALNKFYIHEGKPHIKLTEKITDAQFNQLVIACPAGLYKKDEKGNYQFDFAGCLECGTCRLLCGDTIIEQWDYPTGTFGIEYRYG